MTLPDRAARHTSATAHRRRLQIENCLYENLLHTPYPSVSVSDICRQVGISRKAYYNYYPDKDTCFLAIIDRTIREMNLYVTTTVSDQSPPMEVAVAMMTYWREHRDLLDICVRNNLLHYVIAQHMCHVMEEDRAVLDMMSTPEVKSDADILVCYSTSQLTLMLQWYLRDFQDPVEDMAKKLLRILHVPLLTLPEEIAENNSHSTL